MENIFVCNNIKDSLIKRAFKKSQNLNLFVICPQTNKLTRYFATSQNKRGYASQIIPLQNKSLTLTFQKLNIKFNLSNSWSKSMFLEWIEEKL